MFIVGGTWLLVLGGWMIWTMYAQLREIRTFADTSAKPVTYSQPSEQEKQTLEAKINAFGAAVGRKESASLRLTVEELNALIVSQDATKGMKESAKVESIAQNVRLQISVPINGVPFTGEHYYLNGFVEVSPEKDKEKGLLLQTRELIIPGKTVTEGFLGKYKEMNPLDSLLMDNVRQSKNTAIMEVLKKVTTLRLEPGAAILEYAPEPTKP